MVCHPLPPPAPPNIPILSRQNIVGIFVSVQRQTEDTHTQTSQRLTTRYPSRAKWRPTKKQQWQLTNKTCTVLEPDSQITGLLICFTYSSLSLLVLLLLNLNCARLN